MFSMNTSASANNGYVVQHMPDRYIKITVLEAYLDQRVDEFGRDWTLQVRPTVAYTMAIALIVLLGQSHRGYYTLTARRGLTEV